MALTEKVIQKKKKKKKKKISEQRFVQTKRGLFLKTTILTLSTGIDRQAARLGQTM